MTRASLGVQTFDPEVQRLVNRFQPVEQVATAVDDLRGGGVAAINFDMMYGLPGQTCANVAASMATALALEPDRVALFGYAHVPWMKKHQAVIRDADLADVSGRWAQAEAAESVLAAHGYVRIGMDHYARPDDPMTARLAEGTLHRNFQGYTDDPSSVLIGVGPSAISSLPFAYAQNRLRVDDSACVRSRDAGFACPRTWPGWSGWSPPVSTTGRSSHRSGTARPSDGRHRPLPAALTLARQQTGRGLPPGPSSLVLVVGSVFQAQTDGHTQLVVVVVVAHHAVAVDGPATALLARHARAQLCERRVKTIRQSQRRTAAGQHHLVVPEGLTDAAQRDVIAGRPVGTVLQGPGHPDPQRNPKALAVLFAEAGTGRGKSVDLAVDIGQADARFEHHAVGERRPDPDLDRGPQRFDLGLLLGEAGQVAGLDLGVQAVEADRGRGEQTIANHGSRRRRPRPHRRAEAPGPHRRWRR